MELVSNRFLIVLGILILIIVGGSVYIEYMPPRDFPKNINYYLKDQKILLRYECYLSEKVSIARINDEIFCDFIFFNLGNQTYIFHISLDKSLMAENESYQRMLITSPVSNFTKYSIPLYNLQVGEEGRHRFNVILDTYNFDRHIDGLPLRGEYTVFSNEKYEESKRRKGENFLYLLSVIPIGLIINYILNKK